MTEWCKETSPQVKARIAGSLYLVVIAAGMFAEVFVRGRLFVHGDAAATAHNIVTHELLYRLGFAAEVFLCACNVPLILLQYDLFKVVNKKIAVLMVLFDLVGTAIESVSLLAHFAPIVLLGGGHALSALTEGQLQAWSYLSVQLFEYGFAISFVFFGLEFLPLACLIVRSNFFPHAIGVLLAIESFAYLVNSFTLFLAPALQERISPYFMGSGIGEVAFCLWLLVMGVNVPRWKEQAGAAELAF
jgi:Domain of unknown function (DUF4386)